MMSYYAKLTGKHLSRYNIKSVGLRKAYTAGARSADLTVSAAKCL